MQSASVLIETATTAGQRPAQVNESASRTGGGLFGQELKQQQQQQMDEQRSLDSAASSNSENGVASRSHDSSDTASNSDQSEDTAQQNGGESATNSGTADSESSAETGHALQSAEGDGDAGASESETATHSQFNQFKMVEMDASESDAELSLQLASQNGADLMTSENPTVDENGNILPLDTQDSDVVLAEATQQLESETGEEAFMAVDTAQVGEESIAIKGDMSAADTDIDIEQASLATNGASQEQTQKNKVVSANTDVEVKEQAKAIATPEQTVIDPLMAGEVDPAAQAVAPVLANSSQTVSSSHNDPLTPNSGVTTVVGATASQSAGTGTGSDNSNSMAGRQQQTNLGAMLAEGDADSELAQPSDKTSAFLESLKSIAKEGGKGADVQPVVQTGVKSQSSQVAQMITQLSSFQSVSQSQAATAATTSPTALSATDSTPAMMTIATSMRQQGWDRAMGERLVFMARNGIQEAQIQVNPRQLGPIDIKVSVNQEQQTHVSFVTTTNAAREVVDAAMPRLREMFDQAGLNLAESEVSQREQQSGKGESTDDEGSSNGQLANGVEDEQDEIMASQVGYIRPSGLDLFA